MSRYQKEKQRARDEAIEWQADFPNHAYSWGDLLYFQGYFETLARRYGLVREFRENCII